MDSPDHSQADKMAVAVPRAEDFQPWETCMTINNTWAYRPKDHNFKSTDILIRVLIEVISRAATSCWTWAPSRMRHSTGIRRTPAGNG